LLDLYASLYVFILLRFSVVVVVVVWEPVVWC
jgi:hypothetical protein